MTKIMQFHFAKGHFSGSVSDLLVLTFEMHDRGGQDVDQRKRKR